MLSAAQDKTTATSGTSSEPPRSPDPRSTCDADGWLPKPRHDRRPKVPAHRLRAYQPAHPVKLSRMARKRAQQRWSALLKRIADKVRAMLGDALWADFVAHANACYKDALLSAFRKPILRCVGPPHGGVCPRNFHVDLTCARAYATLGELHLDHEQDLVVTCDMWVQALASLPRAPSSWDDGVDGALLCHLLFSVRYDPAHGAAMLRFRCGPVPGQHGTKTDFCHELNMPHYRGLRDVALNERRASTWRK